MLHTDGASNDIYAGATLRVAGSNSRRDWQPPRCSRLRLQTPITSPSMPLPILITTQYFHSIIQIRVEQRGASFRENVNDV
eukprot:7541410-Pyramimonas_sp.AAC.1